MIFIFFSFIPPLVELFAIILTITGLCMFEIICSIDNAIINAEVLSTMQPKYQRWFLLWGMLIAVFLVRGLLPLLLVWGSTPELTPWEAFTAMFSDNPDIEEAIKASSPILLIPSRRSGITSAVCIRQAPRSGASCSSPWPAVRFPASTPPSRL